MAFQNVNVLQRADAPFESPAKAFARLKSKVQSEAKEDAAIDVKPLREKQEADFKSPVKRPCSPWIYNELKENQRFDSYHSEVEALTVSPMSSPQKAFGCNPGVERPHVTDIGHALQPRNQHTPTKRTLPESPGHRPVNGFTGTPVKTQAVKNICAGWLSEEMCAPLEQMMSPSKRFTLMKNSLGKRKLGQQEKDINTKKQLKESKGSAAAWEDDTNICTEQSEMNQISQEPVFAQLSIATKWCNGNQEKQPPVSPAKMFAYMMERERKREQQEAPRVTSSSSTRELEDVVHYTQVRDTPPSTADNTDEMEDTASRGVAQSPDKWSRLEEPSAAPPPAAPSQPVLLQDPLVLNSPRICIPKKNKAVFKHNKWPQDAPFPSESVLHLTKWFLRRNCKGMFIDGLLKECRTPWNTNIIVERMSSSVLKTVSGRVYVLVGKMMEITNSVFPNWFLKKFAKGFPPNWKELYEKFLSESKEKSRRDTERNREKGSTVPKKTPKGSSPGRAAKRNKQKHLNTSESCVPASSSSTKLSRSGRMIKPPLEYWKGGRVILDAQMNVTIYECYDTSICQPKVTTTICTKSQKLAPVPSGEGRKQYESSSNSEPSVPQRKVKSSLRKCNRAKAKPEEQPPPPTQTHVSSSEEPPGNMKRCRSTRKTQTNSVPPSQSKQEKPPTQKSNKRTHKTRRSSGSSSAEHPTFLGKAPRRRLSSSSEEEFTDNRKKQSKGTHRKAANKSRPSSRSPSNQPEKSMKEPRTSSKVPRQKRRKTPPPKNPTPKPTQFRKGQKGHKAMHQEQNEDEWTEAELIKLQQAVSCYPKYMTGYWAKVAMMVGTRSAKECHNQHMSQGNSQTPAKKTRKQKVEAPKDSAQDCPLISARAGTFKRKQQVRQFLDAMPRDIVEDAFRSSSMQNKRFKIPSMCESEDDSAMADLEPVTPMTTRLHEAKTPQCLHITPNMMGSPSRHNKDKYIFQLQKRMKKNQFNVQKQSSKSFTPSPTVKRKMRKCGNTENDTFVFWEMFPDQEHESGEEEDFYFSDKD